MATQSSTNLKLRMLKTVAAAIQTLLTLGLVIPVLFFLAGTAHADILVSNYDHGTVDKYNDDGTLKQPNFLTGVAFAEGVQCVARSQNLVYVGNSHSGVVKVYDLLTGEHYAGQDFTISGASSVIALAMDAGATELYAADYYGGHLYALNLPINGPGETCTPASPCVVNTQFLVLSEICVDGLLLKRCPLVDEASRKRNNRCMNDMLTPDWIKRIKKEQSAEVERKSADVQRSAAVSRILATDGPAFFQELLRELAINADALEQIGYKGSLSHAGSPEREQHCRVLVAKRSITPDQNYTDVFYEKGSNSIRCHMGAGHSYALMFQVSDNDDLFVAEDYSPNKMTARQAAEHIVRRMIR